MISDGHPYPFYPEVPLPPPRGLGYHSNINYLVPILEGMRS